MDIYIKKQTVKSVLSAIEMCKKDSISSANLHYKEKVYKLSMMKPKNIAFDYNNLDAFFNNRKSIGKDIKVYKTTLEDLWIYYPNKKELWSAYRKG